MKLILEILIAVFLHPVAVVLIWINLLTDRSDLGALAKAAWAGFSLLPFVPILYALTGGEYW